MNPEIFSIGSLSIRWYSVLILLGIVVAFFLADRQAKKENLPKDFVFDLGFWLVIFGILGARLYYVIFNFGYYKKNLLEVFAIWNGGLAIHGGIIAGFITIVVYAKKNNINLFKVTDIVVPSLIIAQAIGRWGNFFNQEAYGKEVGLSFLKGLHIPNFISKNMFIIDKECPMGCYHHPTFLYECLWCLLGFIIMMLIIKFFKKRKTGQLTSLYLIWYSLGRFFIESLRTDSLMLGSIKMAQFISLVMMILGIVGMFVFSMGKNKNKGEIK